MGSDNSLRLAHQQRKHMTVRHDSIEVFLSSGVSVLARKIELVMNNRGITTEPNSLLYSIKDLKLSYITL